MFSMTGWLVIIEFVAGCALLGLGASRFIRSSAVIGRRLGLSSLMLGMLLVGFGTSLPEILVSILAAARGNAAMSIGNAVGSNIANAGLVVSVVAFLSPLSIHSQLIKREFPIMLLVTGLVGIFVWHGYLTRLDGVILLIALAIYLVWLFYVIPKEKNAANDALIDEYRQAQPMKPSIKKSVLWWIVGLAGLLIGADMIVSGASKIAAWFGVSDLVIGLTIVAVGTSLPELASSIVAAKEGEHDIALGNVVGSNIFNLLAVLAMPALISPSTLSEQLRCRDYPVMLGFTVLLWVLTLLSFRQKKFGRVFAGVLMSLYVVYLAVLVMTR